MPQAVDASARASFELEPPDEAEMARRSALLDGGFPYLVAEIDGAVAGYAYAGPYRRGRPIVSASRIPSTSRPRRSAAASAARCSKR